MLARASGTSRRASGWRVRKLRAVKGSLGRSPKEGEVENEEVLVGRAKGEVHKVLSTWLGMLVRFFRSVHATFHARRALKVSVISRHEKRILCGNAGEKGTVGFQ